MLNAQHIEAIQQSRKNIFDKQHKKLSLRSGMLVLLRDARKLDFRGILDVVWLGPYLIGEVFPNNSAQLETLNGEYFPTHTSGN